MSRYISIALAIIIITSLTGCPPAPDDANDNVQKTPPDLSFNYDFEKNMDGWTSGFTGINSHYLSQGYDINFTHGDYTYMDTTNKGIYLAGNNLESDLFMYTTKKFSQTEGLKPLTKYMIDLYFDAISTMVTALDEIPENQIHVKAGVVDRLPQPNLTANAQEDGIYWVNIDMGAPATDGKDLSTLGNLAIGNKQDKIYGQKAFQETFYAQSNSQGELWVIIGTDTTREGSSSIYFDNIKVDFSLNE